MAADIQPREVNVLSYADGYTWQVVYSDGVRVEGRKRYTDGVAAIVEAAQFVSLVDQAGKTRAA